MVESTPKMDDITESVFQWGNEKENYTDKDRQARLLADLASEGSARCCYAHDSAQWPNSICDCKYVTYFTNERGEKLPLSGEQTGCCEIRAAYRMLVDFIDHDN